MHHSEDFFFWRKLCKPRNLTGPDLLINQMDLFRFLASNIKLIPLDKGVLTNPLIDDFGGLYLRMTQIGDSEMCDMDWQLSREVV